VLLFCSSSETSSRSSSGSSSSHSSTSGSTSRSSSSSSSSGSSSTSSGARARAKRRYDACFFRISACLSLFSVWNVSSISTVHNKSVHTCICVSVYVHIFLNYAFPWRNIYSCCFCPSPYHCFQGHRAITPLSLFATPSSNPSLSFWLTVMSCSWKQQLPSKCCYLSTKMHCPMIVDDSNLHSHHLEDLRFHILLPSLMMYLCSEQSIISHTFV